MTPRAFLGRHGKVVSTVVAERAGTNWPYFSQIAYGHRRPSVELAERLVKASKKVVRKPRAQLDFVSLMKSKAQAA